MSPLIDPPNLPDFHCAALELLFATAEPATQQRLVATLEPEATQHEVPPAHRPAEGAEVLAALRLVDEAGRRAAVGRWRRLRRVGEALHLLPPPPLFPARSQWSAPVRGASATATLLLSAPPARLGYSTIELERQDAAGDVAIIATLPTIDLAAMLRLDVTLLPEPQRLRWVLTTTLGDEVMGPWSSAVRPAPVDATYDGVSLGVQTS
jgi:hypothetical protein